MLEAGVCTSNHTKKLHHANKEKSVSDVRMSRNAACTENLSKQKVKHAIDLFSRNIASALEDECGKASSGTCNFLRMFDDDMMQPLLNVSATKGKKVKEAAVLVGLMTFV